MNKTICVSGGFDPLHIGHLEMFREAATHGELVVILNSDDWLLRKKGFCFLPWEQRAAIIGDLAYVKDVVAVDDAGDTACEALQRIRPNIFANGGDRTQESTPEMSLCNTLGIQLLWGIGGGKSESSSDIASRAWVKRNWGSYRTLDEGPQYKVKKLIIAPKQSISLQYHHHRDEYWYVAESTARVELDGQTHEVGIAQQPVIVKSGMHHKLTNPANEPLVIIEIQSGNYLGEDDIVRMPEVSKTQ